MTEIADARFSELLTALERIAGGDLDHRIPMTPAHDELDALAHAINVLVGELQIVAEGLRRAKEEAEAASLAKTTFLRNVSHEIRTPLSSILIMSELLASKKLPTGKEEELHRRIAANGRALVSILDDLLDLAKIEAGKLDFELEPTSMLDLTTEVVATFEALAQRKGLRLAVEHDGRSLVHALVDAKRARQILTNVLGNALKFTSQGEVVVRLGASSDGQHVLVDVADTGIGLTPEQSRALFEPFVQADQSISRRFGGSGLGLALSLRFAEGMGGCLGVLESEPGVGTTFRVALPVAGAPAAAESADPDDSDDKARRVLGGRKVLLVEDNDEVRAITAELLRLVGAAVVEAANGQDALDLARETTFDVILMDVRMPGMDGAEATRRLRGQGVSVPIVAVTADAVPEQTAACFDAGCTGFLRKPIDLEQLARVLRPSDGAPPSSR